MAQRRMFSLDVVDTDSFLDLPASSQSLYFHMGMRADDDGFVSSPKKITAMVNCSGDDLKLLVAKGFVIPFDSGVCVVRDWKVNNYIQKDRYRASRYTNEKSYLSLNESGSYLIMDTKCIQGASKVDTQVRLGEASIEKKSVEVNTGKPSRFSPPTIEQVTSYCQDRRNRVDPQSFVDFYISKGWRVGREPMRDWQAAVRTWERRDGAGCAEPVKQHTGKLEIVNGEEVYLVASN